MLRLDDDRFNDWSELSLLGEAVGDMFLHATYKSIDLQVHHKGQFPHTRRRRLTGTLGDWAESWSAWDRFNMRVFP